MQDSGKQAWQQRDMVQKSMYPSQLSSPENTQTRKTAKDGWDIVA